MASPFSSKNANLIPTWSKLAKHPTTFQPYNPFGIFSVDQGFGSGGFGDLPFGENVISKVVFTTAWTPEVPPSDSFTTVQGHVATSWTGQ